MKTQTPKRILPARDETEIFANRIGGISIEQRPLDNDPAVVCFAVQDIPIVIEHLRKLAAELNAADASPEGPS